MTNASPAPVRPWLAPTLLAILVLAVYGPLLYGGFLNFDDDIHVYDNPYFHPITAAHLAQFWREPYRGLFIPIAYWAFAGLAALGYRQTPLRDPDGWPTHFDPHIFHAANVLLHLGSVLWVYAILKRIVGRPWAACAGAALFAVHPLQVESVAWISELRGVLGSFFGLAAAWLYLRAQDAPERRNAAYAGSLALFTLGLLSKPSLAALPFMLLPLGRLVNEKPWNAVFKTTLPYFVLAVVDLLLTQGVQPVAENIRAPLWQRPFVAGDALAFYLGKLILPTGLSLDYRRAPYRFAHHLTWYASILVPMIVGGLIWRFRARLGRIPAASLVFVAALLPTLGLVPFAFQFYSTVADRYAYLAMLGPALALADALARKRSRIVPAVTCLLVAAWSGLSSLQQQFWLDGIRLYRQMLTVTPDSFMLHHDLGALYEGRKMMAAAEEQYRLSLQIWPADVRALTSVGRMMDFRGDHRGAEGYYRRALEAEPHFGDAEFFYGQSLKSQGRTVEAIPYFQAAVQDAPNLRQAAQTALDSAVAETQKRPAP